MPRLDLFLKNGPKILWATFVGLLEWIVPRSWYAKDVSNDIVLITGAGSGLGREISLEFARLGSSLVLWDIDQKGLEKTQELVISERKKNTLNANQETKFCITYIVDLSNREAIKKMSKKVQEDLNANRSATSSEKYVSILVNNAGIFYGTYMHELTDAQIDKMFQINILAHFWTVRAFLPKMIEYKRGHIMEVASYGGINGGLKQVTYCSTKFATVGFEESLNMELDHLGLGNHIKTTVVCPLYFKSSLFSGIDSDTIDMMSTQYVGREAVLTMRCNHSRVLLPKSAYIFWVIRAFLTRSALVGFCKALGIDQGLRDVRGRALEQ